MPFLKRVQLNNFIYYGIKISKAQIQQSIKIFGTGKEDIYAYIHQYGLDYIRVGDANKSSEFIIGEQIAAKYSFSLMEISFSDDNISLNYPGQEPINIKLSYEDEYAINRRLQLLGFLNIPKYYIAQNYQFNN